MRITEFNELPADDAAATAAVWAAIPHWVDAVVAARPYASAAALSAHARALSTTWSPDDLDAAVARHPRIGEKVTGGDAESRASRGEQSSMAAASDEVAAAIAVAGAAYEDRFGRVFLIRATGRSPEEMLAEAQRRLGNDADAEAAEALEQLRQIALLRLSASIDEE